MQRFAPKCRLWAPPLWLAFGLALSPAGSAWAGSECLYRGSDESARVVTRSGDFHTPFPVLARARDCTRLEVVVGKVLVYEATAGADGKADRAITVREVLSGPLVKRGDSAALDGLKQAFDELGLLLAGDQRLTQGSSRSGEAQALAAEIPSGLIAALGSGMAEPSLPLGGLADTGLELFELRQGTRLLHQQKGRASALLIPLGRLQPGALLSWQFRHEGQSFSGQLEIRPAEEAAAIVAGAKQGQTDATAASLQAAAALLAAGYRWDARTLLRLALVAQP